jgi:hypothetical protein
MQALVAKGIDEEAANEKDEAGQLAKMGRKEKNLQCTVAFQKQLQCAWGGDCR